MWRLVYAIPTWIAFQFVFWPLLIVGWVLVPLAALCGAYYESNGIYHFTSRYMYLFDNIEDGIANNTYSGDVSMFMRITSWFNRNPVNNLRTAPYLSCFIDPEKVGFTGSFTHWDGQPFELLADPLFIKTTKKYDTLTPQWFFSWCGAYTTWYWIFNFRGSLYRVILGFNIYPTFVYGVTPAYSKGSGFSMTFKKIT